LSELLYILTSLLEYLNLTMQFLSIPDQFLETPPPLKVAFDYYYSVSIADCLYGVVKVTKVQSL